MIFTLQDEIADEVLQALKLKLAGELKKRARRHTENPEAYRLYLKGRFYWPNARRTVWRRRSCCIRRPWIMTAGSGISEVFAIR